MQVIWTILTNKKPDGGMRIRYDSFPGFSTLKEQLSQFEFSDTECAVTVSLKDEYGDEHIFASKSINDQNWRH